MEIPDGGRHQINDGSDQVPNCDICKEKISDGYCGECETQMCQSCFDGHLNLKSCRYHVLSDDFEQPTVDRKTHTEPCKIHENQIIEFVCVDHRKVGCAKCMLADHSACKREDINVAAKRFQGSKDDTRLSQNMQKVETMCTDCTQRIHHLTQTVAAANDKAVNDIDAFKASVIESIDETVRVALIKAERLRLENENQIEKRAVFLKKITNSMALLKASLKNREELEKVFIAAMDMEPKLAEYQEILSTLKTEDITAEYTFHPQKTILDMISDSRLLGEVIQDTDTQGDDPSTISSSGTEDDTSEEELQDVQKFIEMREAEMNYGGNSYRIDYQKTIPCEIPDGWEEKIKVQRGKPPVPQKRGPISHLPQLVGQYGLVSGFYENVPGSDGHHPAPGGNIGGDPNITGNPGQQQFAPGGMAYPQQQGYPYPGYGYTQNVDPAQQNIPPGDHGIPHGQQYYPGFGYSPNMDPNQQNIPPDDHDIPHGQQNYPGFGYPPNMDPNQQNIPPGDQGVPQGQQGYYQQPQLPPGMMLYRDPNINKTHSRPISGYASQSDAAHSYPGQVPHMQPGPPQGPPPPYAEQMFGFNPQNRTEQKVPLESKDDSSGEEDQPEPDDGAEQLVPKLIVTNIPSNVDVEYIEWFFERKKNFGGLDIQDVIYNEEDACAIVEFGSSEDVDAVLERVPIKMKGKEVEVQRYEPEPKEPIDPCTVLVSGPEAILSDIRTLEYYFESKKRSGGGDIADIKYDEDLIVVVITFEDEEDAQRVIEKTDHKVNKHTITVDQYKPMKRNVPVYRETAASDNDFEEAKEVILDTVRISGVTAPIRSTAELYFENSKRSGGGDYDECWSDPDEEGVIFIKFNNLEDAQKVLERDHDVKGKRLTVESYVKETVSTPKPPVQKANPEPDDEIIL